MSQMQNFLLILCIFLANIPQIPGNVLKKPEGNCPIPLSDARCVSGRENACESHEECGWNEMCCSNGCEKFCMKIPEGSSQTSHGSALAKPLVQSRKPFWVPKPPEDPPKTFPKTPEDPPNPFPALPPKAPEKPPKPIPYNLILPPLPAENPPEPLPDNPILPHKDPGKPAKSSPYKPIWPPIPPENPPDPFPYDPIWPPKPDTPIQPYYPDLPPIAIEPFDPANFGDGDFLQPEFNFFP
ncbi:uncharacterized protein [Hyperolius riggenbachi]|uniref:uncharacterized protein n=1 Tax=Hyperolius riggenbachi TaxID=752182 RepID=UPI0035A2F165